MSEHTPGPWRVEKFNDTKSWSIYANGGTHSLASIRDAANARLIAAAPELLQALRDARESLIARGADPVISVLREINAAIAKTEGRS